MWLLIILLVGVAIGWLLRRPKKDEDASAEEDVGDLVVEVHVDRAGLADGLAAAGAGIISSPRSTTIWPHASSCTASMAATP